MNITEEEKSTIHSKLPDLVNFLYEGESESYSRDFTCVFDHWLDREESFKIFQADTLEERERQQNSRNLYIIYTIQHQSTLPNSGEIERTIYISRK